LHESTLKGYKIPGDPEKLIATLFADDTTVFLNSDDDCDHLQSILAVWCSASSAAFNVNKTAIIPDMSRSHSNTYRVNLLTSRRLSPARNPIPHEVEIMGEGKPVRVLGAWVGNNINQASIWVPTLEKVEANLNRWNKGHPTLEGHRHIINVEVGARTQYLTRVQGMPKQVEKLLGSLIRSFFW
ncbi:hypothetical protein M422DRAFT_104548, partial [Sphaerobolus stellatus SS14]